MHFGNDASFTVEALITRQNADLSNDLGNLFSRVLAMADQYFGAVVPAPGVYGQTEIELQTLAGTALQNYQTLFVACRFANALECLWEFIRALNRYVDFSAPWVLFKENKPEKLATVLYTLLESLRKVALNLWPVMPGSSVKMLEQLGLGLDPANLDISREIENFGILTPGLALAKHSNLFPRFDLKKPEKPEEQAEAARHADAVPACTFADFQKLDLRAGTILTAEQHPDADKLLCLQVDLGEAKPRSIVSGIAEFYAPREIIGRQVVVVANLPTRKIRKVESQGMLLTVQDETGLCLVTPSDVKKTGSKVS
jgi:methionyl-tRNA synthetase